ISQDIALSVRYCEPSIRVEQHADTVQLLVHGITYTKSYWSALDVRETWARNNSWEAYASSQGYATLNIDRPGNGLSTRIDPFWADQLPFQIAAVNEVALALKSQKLLGRSFEKVALVGHSFGSIIASFIAEQYPETLDALLLTGYTRKLDTTPVFATLPLPASSVSPKFASLSSGYLATSSVSARLAAMYGQPGTYDPRFVARDLATQDTVTIGEIATTYQTPSERYQGPVAVITGGEDAIFCYDNSTKRGDCGSGETSIPAETRADFPNASNFSYFIADTGHDINLHYRAPGAFAYAHAWLEENG
ncbi:alpha/beta-hydrolase, partial [Thozetella sp. PMI_491]